MKPPYVQITAFCDNHGTFRLYRKPNKRQAQRREHQGFYDAVKCPKCPWWATITAQVMVTVDPAKPNADCSVSLQLPGMEG